MVNYKPNHHPLKKEKLNYKHWLSQERLWAPLTQSLDAVLIAVGSAAPLFTLLLVAHLSETHHIPVCRTLAYLKMALNNVSRCPFSVCFPSLPAFDLWMWNLWRLSMRRSTLFPSWPKQTHSPLVKSRKRKLRQDDACFLPHINLWMHCREFYSHFHIRHTQTHTHRLFPCAYRSERRLSSTASRYTNSPTATPMKMRNSSSKTSSWRSAPRGLAFVFFVISTVCCYQPEVSNICLQDNKLKCVRCVNVHCFIVGLNI